MGQPRSTQSASGRRWFASACTALLVGALLVPASITAANAADRTTRESGRPAPLATLEIEAAPVQVKPAGKASFAEAKDGRALKAGDTVRTTATGRAQIDYADGSLTRLDVNTEYQLVKLSSKKGDRKTKGVQTAGQTWHRVEALTESESYKVEGANATAAVLGTAFFVSCDAPNSCTFTAVIDDIRLVDSDARGGTKTITLSPGDQVEVDGNAIGTVTELTQEELLAIQWIVQNLIADQNDGKSTGTSEISTQDDPPPTRPPSTPVAILPPTAPPTSPVTTTVILPAPSDTGDGDDDTGIDGSGGGEGGGEGVPANRAPIALAESISVPEDSVLVVPAPGVLTNDSDPDGDDISAVLGTGTSHGTIDLAVDGGFVYTPTPNFSGVDSFSYRASDGTELSELATVTINVGGSNDGPVAFDDGYSMPEDSLLAIGAPGVLGNDLDPEGAPLQALLASQPAHGALFLDDDGSFVYFPDANFNGIDSFTYVAGDGEFGSLPATVTITVGAQNDAPVAQNDQFNSFEVAAPGVLGNDSDADGNALTAVLETGPANGEVVLESDGSFTYTPDEGFDGSDSFTYRASDGSAQSAPATVTISVEASAIEVLGVVHEVPIGGSVAFPLASAGATSLTIETLPTAGTLWVGDSQATQGMEIAPSAILTYFAPDVEIGEGGDLFSFTWSATNSGGESAPVTEYLKVGGLAIVADVFEFATPGQQVHIVVPVNSPVELGEFECAVWIPPNGGTVDGILFPNSFPEASPEHTWTLLFTPDVDTGGMILSGFIGAAFGDAGQCETFTDLSRVFIAVGFTGDTMPAPGVSVSPSETLVSEQGEPVEFTVNASDGVEGSELPLTIDCAPSGESPPGDFDLINEAYGAWTYQWTPFSEGAAQVDFECTVSNGFRDSDPVTVSLSFHPNQETTTTSTTTTTTGTPTTTIPPTTTTTAPESQ